MNSSEFRTWFVWCVWAGALNVAALLSYFANLSPTVIEKKEEPPVITKPEPPEVYFAVAMGEIRLNANESNRTVTVKAILGKKWDRAIAVPVLVEGGPAGETRQLVFAVGATEAEIPVGTFPAPMEGEAGKRLTVKLTPSTNESYSLPTNDSLKRTEIPVLIEGRSKIPQIALIKRLFTLKPNDENRTIELEATLDESPERDLTIAVLLNEGDAKLGVDFDVTGSKEFVFTKGNPKSKIVLEVKKPEKNADKKLIAVKIKDPTDSAIAYRISPNEKETRVEIQAMPRSWTVVVKSDVPDENGKVRITAKLDSPRDADTILPFKLASKGKEGQAFDAIPVKSITIPKGKLQGELEFTFRDTPDLSLPPEVELMFEPDDAALVLKPEPKLNLKWVPDDAKRDLLVLIPFTSELKEPAEQILLKTKLLSTFKNHRDRLIGGRVFLLGVQQKANGDPDENALGEVWTHGGWDIFNGGFPVFPDDVKDYSKFKYKPEDFMFATIQARDEILKRVKARNGGSRLYNFVLWRSNRSPERLDSNRGIYSIAVPNSKSVPLALGENKSGYYFVWIGGDPDGTDTSREIITPWITEVKNPKNDHPIQFRKTWDESIDAINQILDHIRMIP